MELDEQDILNNTTDMDGLENILEEIVKRAKEMGLSEQDIASPTVSTSTTDVDDIPIPEVPKVPIKLTNTGEMDPQTARIFRMLQVVGKFASTLALRPIGVDVVQQDTGWGAAPNAPAWSDSDNIWFDYDAIGDLTNAENITSLKGLSLHEIAHILLTPRAGSNLAKSVQKAKLWRAFNALEDQRIEMMMTKRFGGVADWLSATIAKHLVADASQHSLVFPLLHGRKYLPQDLRDAVYQAYEKPDTCAEIASIIDQYIVLNLADPKKYTIAFDLVQRYANQLNMLDPEPPTNWGSDPVRGIDRIKDPNGHQHRKGGEWKSSKSKPMDKTQQDKLANRVSQDVANQPGLPKHGPGDKPGIDNADQTNQGGTGAASSGDSVGSAAKRALDDVLKRKAKEIATISKQYNADGELSGTNAAKPNELPWKEKQPVSPEAMQASKSFANELARLKSDYDPGWNRNVESGRLSVERYAKGTDFDECFDEWDMGREDAVDIEAVILLDISASMGDALRGAYESMWAIKRAMDKAGASTTVIGFSHEAYMIYKSDERAGSTMTFSTWSGGTAPLQSLRFAQSVLADSKRAIKLCIPITDGSWAQSKDCDDVIRQLRQGGVLTALAYIETSDHYRSTTLDTHGCEVAVNVTNTADLFTLGRAMVRAGVARNLDK